MNKINHHGYDIRTEVGSLADLATTLRDVIRGYDEMLERAHEDLAPALTSLRERHDRDLAEVLLALESSGGEPEATGSVMGVVHEAAATVRDWFGGLDSDALDAVIDGEERVLDQYAATMSETFELPETHAMISAQKQALEAHLTSLKDKRS